MEIIPAFDLREGECARVLGAYNIPEGIHAVDPLEQAEILKRFGAKWVHISDLDGAFSGHLCNLSIIQKLVERSGLKIQHAGGVRTLEHIETLLSLGVARIVLRSAFLHSHELTIRAIEKYGDSLIPGVDGRDGMVAIEAFETSATTSVLNMLERLKGLGVKKIIYTDIRRTGSMKGPNYDGIREIINKTGFDVIIAGGINSYESILKLKEIGANSVIVGKAIYTGAINYQKAVELVNK